MLADSRRGGGAMCCDEALVDRLKAGDAAAFAELVERFERPLYRFFYCSHRDHHAAQERTAETFAQFVQSLVGMRGECRHLRAYVFATARHVQIRQWRQRRPDPAPLDNAKQVADAAPSPLVVASDREQLERALTAIEQLDDPLRNVLFLRFVECLSIDEVAAALRMPVGTVKSHIHRGRARLREELTEKECRNDSSQ